MNKGSTDHVRFLAKLTERFPEIAGDVDDCSRDLLHCEMATVARATQAAIDSGNKEAVRQHFAFVDELFRDAAADVENAIYVSYLENIHFDGRAGKSIDARKMLSPRLQQTLAGLESHWDQIANQKNS